MTSVPTESPNPYQPPPLAPPPGVGVGARVGYGSQPSAKCPRCEDVTVELGEGADATCPVCRWKGQVYWFSPLKLNVEHAQQALSEDAVCIHHPTKKAVATCAGTGDFICALCAIEIKGETYSAAYLDGGGKEKASEHFDRYLDRPDNKIMTMILMVFVPYVNFIMIPFAFVWIPYAFILYTRALKLRQTNAIFARVMGRWRVIIIPVLLSLCALAWLCMAGFGIYALTQVTMHH